MQNGLLQRAFRRYKVEGLKGVRRAISYRLAVAVGSTRRALGTRLAGETAEPDPTPMEAVLNWLAKRDEFVIVQIGAYIGDTANDPLKDFLRTSLPRHPDSVVLLVEPVRAYFDALLRAYADLPAVRFENAAIAEEEGERDFYRLDPNVALAEHRFAWLGQMGSLRADRMSDLWDRFERDDEAKEFWRHHSSVERVRCFTLERLLERHELDYVDLLQIDTEGYDYEILRTIDFSRLRPPFINYERVHLHEDEEPCRRMLTEAGYALFDWSLDTLAVAVPTDRRSSGRVDL